jgi:hypothetical protein
VSLGTVLDLLTEPYELRWLAEEGLVTLDLASDRADEMHFRYHDVKDLCEPILPASIEASPDLPEFPELPEPMFEIEGLVDLVRETVGREEAWEDPAAIEARNGILIVRNTRPILDALDRLLRGLRASRDLVVTTIDQLEMDDETARSLLGGSEVGGYPLLLDHRMKAALDAALASGRMSHLSRERIGSLHGSGSPKATGEEIPYVADYDIESSSSSDSSVPVREVRVLHSGTRIHLRTLPVNPGDQIYVEIVLERAILTGLGQAETPYGAIDLPQEEVWSVRTGLRVPDGQTALVSASRADGRWRLLLVSPQRVPLGE